MSRRRKKLLDPTRRQVISMIGGCGLAPFVWDPVTQLLNGIVEGLIMKAQAETNPSALPPRNYVFCSLSGGPPRWLWDLPLNPYGNPGFIRNPHVATRFSGSTRTASALEYATVPITRAGTTIQMPHLWSQTIPTPASRGGAWVPMAPLMDNMLMIRGVNMLADGHPDNERKQLRPLVSQASLHGKVADHASSPLPAVEVDGAPGGAYKSGKGIGQTRVTNSANPLSQILSPFNRATDGLSSGYLSRRAAMETAVNQALSALGSYAGSSLPGSSDLFVLRNRAENLIKAGIGDVSTAYTTLRNKYQSLFTACAGFVSNANRIPGVSDLAINSANFTGADANALVLDQSGNRFSGADLRDIVRANTEAFGIAEGFAVAEYLILNGYSTSVVFGAGRFVGVGLKSNGIWSFDEHYQGAVGSLLLNTFLFRGLAACLNEFIAVMKENGKFNETVIQIGSEFSRSPNANMADSGHGWQANCTSIFSGAIDRPMVLGNQKLDGNPSGADRGTWGSAATVRVDGSDAQLGIGHSTSTVAHLLRVSPPVSNNSSLVAENGTSGVSPTIDLATTKDEA